MTLLDSHILKNWWEKPVEYFYLTLSSSPRAQCRGLTSCHVICRGRHCDGARVAQFEQFEEFEVELSHQGAAIKMEEAIRATVVPG